MKNDEMSWSPTNYQNKGIITNSYELIKKQLILLQNETNCPDKFVHSFLGSIQKEWHEGSCHSIARKKSRENK
tara:strand:+ start:3613 stop:3831 length:219 start_codon:yes stop_codon:yes gene_type:complete